MRLGKRPRPSDGTSGTARSPLRMFSGGAPLASHCQCFLSEVHYWNFPSEARCWCLPSQGSEPSHFFIARIDAGWKLLTWAHLSCHRLGSSVASTLSGPLPLHFFPDTPLFFVPLWRSSRDCGPAIFFFNLLQKVWIDPCDKATWLRRKHQSIRNEWVSLL